MYKWCHESRRNYTFIKLKATKISKRCVLFWSRGPDGYRKNDGKRAVVWPWLVLELSTVLALTQLGIRQSDWRRAGIRSTNLHIVVEWLINHCFGLDQETMVHSVCLTMLLCSSNYGMWLTDQVIFIQKDMLLTIHAARPVSWGQLMPICGKKVR